MEQSSQLTHIFQRGGSTTNQIGIYGVILTNVDHLVIWILNDLYNRGW